MADQDWTSNAEDGSGVGSGWNIFSPSGTDQNGMAWWETTLQNVISAAAYAKYRLPQIGTGTQYMTMPDGRVVPVGSPIGTAYGAQANQMPQWAVLAALGLGALLLVKLAK